MALWDLWKKCTPTSVCTSWKPVFRLCEQQRGRPACASAQSDQRLYFSLFGKYHTQTSYKRNFIFLASPCNWGDWFESRFVRNPEDRFCRVTAHMCMVMCSRNITLQYLTCYLLHLPLNFEASAANSVDCSPPLLNSGDFDFSSSNNGPTHRKLVNPWHFSPVCQVLPCTAS